MRSIHLLLLVALSTTIGAGAAGAACSAHSDESTAGLCGNSREVEAPREAATDCARGDDVACVGRFQRARDAAIFVVRYRALSRASLDGCASRR